MQWPKQRAWGWYATLIRTPWFCVKVLRFRPYGALSMQFHKHRTESWLFFKGKGKIEHHIPARMFYAEIKRESRLFNIWKIKPLEWHKFTALDKPVYAIELQYGRKVTESDIERKQ